MSRRPVITDREVRRAKREGKTSLDISGAVVTPSGRDAAKAVGLELTGGHASRSVPPGASESGARGRSQPRGAPPEKQSGSAAAPAPHRSPAKATVRQRHHKRTDRNPRDAGAAPAGTAAKPSSSPPATQSGAATTRTIAVGADHGGVAMKDAIAARLRELGHTVLDLGTTGTAAVDYPDFAVAVARAVASREAAFGVMVDGAGIGSSMAANKVQGVRAALCYDVTSAGNAREHNNANVLTLGGGLIGTRLALAIVETFLATPFAGGRHQARVDKIDALDGARGGR